MLYRIFELKGIGDLFGTAEAQVTVAGHQYSTLGVGYGQIMHLPCASSNTNSTLDLVARRFSKLKVI